MAGLKTIPARRRKTNAIGQRLKMPAASNLGRYYI